MKVECIKDRLREAVSAAEKVTGKNLSLPILSSVMIEAIDKKLLIRATNLEVGVEIEVAAKVDAPGKVALNASVLNNFLCNLGREDKVKLELINDNIHISTATSSALLKSFPVDDFPILPRVDSGDSLAIPSKSLILGLRSVNYSSAVSDIKPEISSVYIYQDGSDVVFVATDSFRLAEKRINLKLKGNDFSPVIIPYKSVSEIIRLFEGVGDEIAVNISKNQISLLSSDRHLTATVIDGIFPDYRQIMPKERKTRVTVAKEELINGLKLVNIFADRFNQIDLRINPNEKIFEISSRNQEVGESNVKIQAVFEGEAIDVSFNARYIMDCFQSIPSDSINLDFNEKNRPLLITGSGDNSFRYLVMPVNR